MDAADLVFAGIARQAQLVRDGEVSPSELVGATLDRIEALDPRLNAFKVVLVERALAEAQQAEGRLGAGGAGERPLLGVPIAIKDDADVAGVDTTFGTSAFGPAPSADSRVVALLREAGAIVIGKTNVPEMTIWPFTETITNGATRNPWAPDRVPGGSSGGSAAAVASGMVGAALGSDGAGSIRIPAAWCGLFGLKPSRDRISVAPHDDTHHGWHGMAVYGPLTRSVADAALFLDVTSERRPELPFVQAAAGEPRKLRIAVSFARAPGQSPLPKLDAEHRAAVEETVGLLRSLGHEVVEHDPSYGPVFVNILGRYLRGIKDSVDTMPHPERLEQRTHGMARLGAPWSPAIVARLRRRGDELRERIMASLEGFDVLLTPATTLPAPAVGRWQNRGAFWTLNAVAGYVPWYAIFNATGQPAASVPVGISSRGMPTAVQLVGAVDDEATLLSLSAQLEAARPWAQRRPPIS